MADTKISPKNYEQLPTITTKKIRIFACDFRNTFIRCEFRVLQEKGGEINKVEKMEN